MSSMDKVDVALDSFSKLLHPYPATLITASSKGKNNVMAVAWIMPVSISPPILVMSIKAERYTYELINQSGFFAVNIPTFEISKEVLLCGRKSGREIDKFKAAGFTIERSRCIDAPIIRDCVAHMECRVISITKTGDHMLVAGQVCAAYARKDVFDKMYRLDKHSPLLHVGGDSFTTTAKVTELRQLPKSKPKDSSSKRKGAKH